ncbi:NUDIX hydrolase [Nanoarchaeota archaeon]
MEQPGVGVAAIIRRDGKVLMGKRESGEWCFPGGKLEMHEELEECAIRETLEECGVEIKNIKRGPYVNDPNVPKDIHFVTIFTTADHAAKEPETLEEEIGGWEWFDWDDLPEPLFSPVKKLIELGFDPFD